MLKKEQTTDLAFLLFVTAHFNKLNEEQKNKKNKKRTAEMYIFQVHSIQKYSQSIPFFSPRKFNERCQDFETTEPLLMLIAGPLKPGTEKTPDNPHVELFNLLCDGNLNHR